MTVEHWRMQSGRVANVDLNGHPDAVQGARDLLRTSGAIPMNDESPAMQGEGFETTSTLSEENNMITPSIAENTGAREAIRAWALEYEARTNDAARAVLDQPDFQEWAEIQLRNSPARTLGELSRSWVSDHRLVVVPFPAEATPRGVANVDVGPCMGGEVTVTFQSTREDGEVGVSIERTLYVVVDADPRRTRNQGEPVGAVHESGPMVAFWGVEQYDNADPAKLDALAGVLRRAAASLRGGTVEEVA